MNKITVKRTVLLEAVKKNRAAHAEEVGIAQKGYREAVIYRLQKMLDDAKAGEPIETEVNRIAPQDHTRDYDRVIAMLEMSVEEELEIHHQEFDQYVMDNWDWSGFAKSVNATYVVK